MLTRRIRAALFVATVAGVGFVPALPALAESDAECAGNPRSVGGVLYVDDRTDTGTWVYLESNGSAGLQRDDGYQVVIAQDQHLKDLNDTEVPIDGGGTVGGEHDVCSDNAGPGDTILV